MTTRRMSGMLAAAGPAAPALLESIDAFKRKHVSQNKEIIHKNSGLMRSNSDLSAKLTALQEELMAAKAENLELAAINCQLTAKLDILRAQLKAAHEEIRKNEFTTLALPQGHADTFKSTLDAVVGQLQNMQALYSTLTTAESSPRTYPPISPPDSPESQLATSTSASPIPSTSNQDPQASSSTLNRPRSSTAIVSAPPDLSYISEGSQEPSLSSSQAGYVPYDEYYGIDEEELLQDGNAGDQPSTSSHTRMERTPSPEIEIRRSPSLSPTPSPPSIPPSAMSTSETAARQSRRRNSGVLPPPPRDLAQRKRRNSMSETQAMEMLEAPSSPPRRPSLLDDLGISPDSLSINSIGDIAVRRIRENSPTLVLQEATPPATQEKLSSAATDLGRTIRTSASTESLARAAASNGLLAPNIASQRSSEQRSRNTGDKPAGSAGSIAKPPRKGPLVGAMQGRPVSTSLVSLSGHIVPEGESLKESKEMPEPASTTAEAAKPKVRRGASVIHRRLSSKTAEPSVGSPTSHVSDASETGSTSSVLDVDVSRSTARARSTTPETEPPSIASVLQDISPASLQQQAVSSETARPSKGKNVKEKVSKESIVVKQRVSRENVNGESRPRSKSIVSSEESARVQEKNIKDTQSQETVSETSVASLSESQENSAPAATAMREGRRARGAVNYQEPSLSKKMRAPAGYVPTIKTAASKRGQHPPLSTVASGVRRKSSLEAMGSKALDTRRQVTSDRDDDSDKSDD